LPAAARRAGLRAGAGCIAPRCDPDPPAASHGVIIGGEVFKATGLGEAARIFAAACGALGLARGMYPMAVGGRADAGALPRAAALLLTVNAPSLPLMLARAPADLLRGRRVVAPMAWELPVAPRAWRVAERYAHEIWACSDFAARALERVMPGRVRVVPYPLALAGDVSPAMTRAAFGLAPDAVVVTVMLGLGSSFTRKNPLGAIAAFKAAFPAEAARIEAAVAGAANIRIFAGAWPAEKVAGLLGLTDVVLSLHRSEGFGLVPAQAMLRGIPVVATGWSGNMQYMDAESAALVGFRLVPVADPSRVYGSIPGAVWAEPDVDHAAAQLRLLGDDASLRAALGAKGQAKAKAALDGRQLLAALAANGITA